METGIHAALAPWANFYLLTGTAAAALTGLQFLVQTLLASNPGQAAGTDPEAGIEAFGTPTVVHFTMALVYSAAMSVPWPGRASLAAGIGILGAGALVYSLVVLRRARRQRTYAPVFEDWLWHVILPSASNAGIVVAAFLLRGEGALPTYLLAVATLLLLCVAIHNAWDTVTWLTLAHLRGGAANAPASPAPRPLPKNRQRRR